MGTHGIRKYHADSNIAITNTSGAFIPKIVTSAGFLVKIPMV